MSSCKKPRMDAVVHNWLTSNEASATAASFVLVEAKEPTILFTLGGKLVKLTLPAGEDGIYQVECEDASMMEWCTNMSTFAFERAGSIDLPAFLTRAIDSYIRSTTERKRKHEEGSDVAAMDEEDEWEDDDDGKGWEGFEEDEGAEGVALAEDDWTKWHAIKKRWEAKEAELRRESLAVDEAKKKSQIFSSKAASKIVCNSLMDLMKTGAKDGIEADAVDDNPFQWRIRLRDFPSDSTLYKDVMKLKAEYGYDYVELEFKFLMDLYPFYPPSVRLVRPRLKNFMMSRIVLMEELQLAKWNPVRGMREVIEIIRRLLTTYGEVDDEGGVNDPKRAIPPYTALEFHLLRLGMLTEITPRVVKTLADADAKKLVIPKQRITQKETFVKPVKSAQQGSKAGWAKGTGYGHGSQSDWDVEAWDAAQRKKHREIQELCWEVLHELKAESVPAGTDVVLEQSCLIPFLEQHLQVDSVTEMERQRDLFETVIAICVAMAKHPGLARLFLPLPGEATPLIEYIKEREQQAAIVEKYGSGGSEPGSSSSSRAGGAPSGTAGAPQESLTSQILRLGKLAKQAVADYEASVKAKAAAAAAATPAAGEGKEAKESKEGKGEADEKKRYIEHMSQFKFDEIASFKHHHYFSKHQHEVTSLSRAYMRRLASEYADLSKSLPIDPGSSVFMRVHESKMSFAQMLIIGPHDTPYSRGCFLFDMYFPPSYPNESPKVNLQTTGGGSVRFNPNLYNCGKVCLSLLGTWRGSAGESWNAKTSTFLQVAVSIQSLIMVEQPYFNEPGYERDMGTDRGKKLSDDYNRNIEAATVRWAMIDIMRNPPPGFEKIISSHFFLQREATIKQVEEWAKSNSRVASQLSELKEILAKQTLQS